LTVLSRTNKLILEYRGSRWAFLASSESESVATDFHRHDTSLGSVVSGGPGAEEELFLGNPYSAEEGEAIEKVA